MFRTIKSIPATRSRKIFSKKECPRAAKSPSAQSSWAVHLLCVLSLVDGEVIASGGSEKGWYLSVKPNGMDDDMRQLLRGAEIRPWIMREFERLQLALAPEGLGMSLADGDVPVENLSQRYPEADWGTMLGEIFLETWGC